MYVLNQRDNIHCFEKYQYFIESIKKKKTVLNNNNIWTFLEQICVLLCRCECLVIRVLFCFNVVSIIIMEVILSESGKG